MYILKSLCNLYFEIQAFSLKLWHNLIVLHVKIHRGSTGMSNSHYSSFYVLERFPSFLFLLKKKNQVFIDGFQGSPQNWEKSNIKADQSQKVLHKTPLSAKKYFGKKLPILWKTCFLSPVMSPLKNSWDEVVWTRVLKTLMTHKGSAGCGHTAQA